MSMPPRPVSSAGNNGNHIIVKDGKYHAIAAQLKDGNYVVILPGDKVYKSLDEAVSAALFTPQGETEWNA